MYFVYFSIVYLFGESPNIFNSTINDVTVTFINTATIQQLQLADNIVYEVLCGVNKYNKKNVILPNILSTIQQVCITIKYFFYKFKSKKHKII